MRGRPYAWGGDGNNRRDYPLRLGGICIDRTSREFAGKGSFWVDEVALVTARKRVDALRVETTGGRFGNIYAPGEAIALRFAGYAANLVRLTRGAVKDFEVWNEWTGGCGMNNQPGDHGRLLAPACRAIKGASGEATIVGVGGEYDPQCAQTVATMARTAGAGSMDAFSIHP